MTDTPVVLPEVTVEPTAEPPGPLSPYWGAEIQRWGALIVEYAEPYGVDPDLVAAIIRVESNGRLDAVSHSNAIGLMQVMPREAGYGSRPTKAVLFDPATNIQWGIRILQDGLDYFNGDVALALGEYYDGRANARARTSRTTGYAALVLRYYEAAKQEATWP